MTGADDRAEEFRPPTALESAVHALGADTVRYPVDYIMLPMRGGIRLAPSSSGCALKAAIPPACTHAGRSR